MKWSQTRSLIQIGLDTCRKHRKDRPKVELQKST